MSGGQASRPKAHHRRFGLLLEGTANFFPLATIGAIGDGGITVSPKQASKRAWRLDARTSRDHIDHVAFAPPAPAPKLHYHRRGMVSVQAPGGVRVRTHLTGLANIEGEQVFFFGRRRLHDLVPVPPRVEDSYVVSHAGLPEAVFLAGLVYPSRSIPYLDDEDDLGLSRVQVRGRVVEQCLPLVAHGIDAVLVLRPKLDWRPIPGAATTVLAGLCGPNSARVAATSTDGASIIALMRGADLPVFPDRPEDRSTDRWEYLRNLREGTIEDRRRV